MGDTMDGARLVRKSSHLPNLCLVRVDKPKLLKSWNTSFCSMKQHTSQHYTVHAMSQDNACAHEVAVEATLQAYKLGLDRKEKCLTPPAPSLCCFSMRCTRALPLTLAHHFWPPTLA